MKPHHQFLCLAAGLMIVGIPTCPAQITPDNYDVLFLNCDGTGTNFTDSSTANPKVVTANGNAKQLPIKFNRTAGFFNGTTDYVVVPDHDDWNFDTGNYDVELFVNLNSRSTTGVLLDVKAQSFAVILTASGVLQIFQNGNARIEYTWNPSLNTWYHLRVQRLSGITSLYIDNVACGTPYAGNDNIQGGTTGLYIARQQDANQWYFSGWMKELRISRTARTVAVPTSQYTAAPDTALLMHFDSPAASPLGPAIAFDGNGDFLTVSNGGSFAFGTGDFTIETWFNQDIGYAGANTVFDSGYDANGTLVILYSDNSGGGYLRYYYNNGASTISQDTLIPKQGSWMHVAIVRASGITKVYCNGREGASGSDSYDIKTTTPLTIGKYYNVSASPTNRFLKEYRVSNFARYTNTFTPSQNGFSVDNNTKLYIKGNEANGATNITDATGKTVTNYGDTKIKYTEDYRSFIFKDDSNPDPALCKKPYPQGGAKVDFFAAFGTGVWDASARATDDYLSAPPHADFDFGNGSWTIEGFVRTKEGVGAITTGGGGTIASKYFSPNQGWIFQIDFRDDYKWFRLYDSIALTHQINILDNFAPLTWYHLMLACDGNTLYAFVNGKLQGTTAAGINGYNGGNQVLAIGNCNNGTWSDPLRVDRIDNIRISKGIARYTNSFNPVEPEISVVVQPTRLDFGEVATNELFALPLSLSNTSSVPVTVGLQVNPPFTVSTNTLPLAMGEVRVMVTFAPTAVGVFSNILSLSGVASPTAITLIGEGVDMTDTDGDGIPDYWETRYRLSTNNTADAALIPPGDRITYLQKYRNRLDPQTPDTDGDGITDFAEIFIYGTDPKAPAADPTWRNNRAYYDRNDRLVGVEYANGLAISYQYDGNNNLRRQTHLQQDAAGLPVLWKFQNGLTNGMANNGLFDDPDGDGWSNYQEWKAGSNPMDARSVPQTNIIQTAPSIMILPDPSRGAGLAVVNVQMWDAEGNAAMPLLQYSNNLATGWSNATLVGLDGNGPHFAQASPTGSVHQLIWNAAMDLGVSFTNDLALRARATDVSSNGAWSSVVGYRVEISAGNPMATNDAISTPEDTPVEIDVLVNDAVSGGLSKVLAGVGQPLHGSAAIANNRILYLPATNYFGSDSFVYTLSDGAGGTSMAPVVITVIPVNDPPVAKDYTFETPEDTPAAFGWNLDKDAEGDLVTLKSVSANSARGGQVVLQNGVISYSPATNFNGTDTFTYTVEDNGQTAGTNDFKTATGTVTVNVTAVNDAPIINIPPDQQVGEDVRLVLTNIMVVDVDAGSGLMRLSLSATNGVLQLGRTNGLAFISGTNGANSFLTEGTLTDLNAALSNLTYQANANYYGADAIRLTVTDQGNTGSGGPLTDQKVIAVSILASNDPPVVTLLQPTNGAWFIARKEPIALAALATNIDVGVQIIKVEFLGGTNIIATLTNSPYQFVWTNVPAGSYGIYSRATDSRGVSGFSGTNDILVKEPGMFQYPVVESNQFRLVMQNTVAGETYRIESSTNLQTWSTNGTVTNLTGQIEVQDAFAPNQPRKFYRAVLVK